MEAFSLIIAGFFGGLILNVMPCVLPPLFFKISHLIQHTELAPAARRAQGWVYLLGTLSTFGVFAAVVIALRMSGSAFGWGMQMQNAPFIICLILVTFLFTLNTFDLFEIPGLSQTSGKREINLKSAYVDGIFVTLLSIPCSAPFLGTAVTAALASDQAWWGTLGLFSSIAVGLATPVVLICLVPQLYRLLPRPGAWMNSFRRFVAFSLLATTAWLFSQYLALVGEEKAMRGLYFLCLLATLCWLRTLWEARGRAMRLSFEGLAVMLLLTGGSWALADGSAQLPWQHFSAGALQQRLDRGQPVFVDFTADWCVSCKTFEAAYLNRQSMRTLFEESGVQPMKADLTRPDDVLWETLRALGRDGLPVYVLYHPDGTHELLAEGPPLGLEPKLSALGKRFPKSQFREFCP